MNCLPVIYLFLLIAVQNLNCQDEYPSIAKVDIDEVLSNERLLKNYFNCIIGKGKCTPEGEDLKKYIPDALENECAKCSDEHKKAIRKVIHYLVDNKRNWWDELVAKFDPNGEYKERYSHYLEEEGITL